MLRRTGSSETFQLLRTNPSQEQIIAAVEEDPKPREGEPVEEEVSVEEREASQDE